MEQLNPLISSMITGIYLFLGFSGSASGKESVRQCRRHEMRVRSLGWGRSPRVGNGNPLQYSCLENPHGQRSLAGYSPRSHKESDMSEHPSTHTAHDVAAQ